MRCVRCHCYCRRALGAENPPERVPLTQHARAGQRTLVRRERGRRGRVNLVGVFRARACLRRCRNRFFLLLHLGICTRPQKSALAHQLRHSAARCRALLATCKRAHSCAVPPARHHPGDRCTNDRVRGGVPSRAWRVGRAWRKTHLPQLRPPPCRWNPFLVQFSFFQTKTRGQRPWSFLRGLCGGAGRAESVVVQARGTMTGVGMGSA